MVAPTSPKSLPISVRPLARPHFGKYTWASSAKRSRMLSPVDVTPPWSNALRYSRATDFRCSSVIVWVLTAMRRLLSDSDHHVTVDPFRERLAVTGDGVPFPVEVVVASGVPDGEARVGPVVHLAHRVDHPLRQHDSVGPGHEPVDDFLHRHDRPL